MGNSLSNLNKKIESCVDVTKNISKYWVNGSYETKSKIQNLLFPDGVVIYPKNREYRTENVNSVFQISSAFSKGSDGVNNKRQPISKLPLSVPSGFVAGARLERTTFGL